MSPKTVGAYIDITRKLSLQSSPAIESLIKNDLTSVLALAIDKAAICGNSASDEPTGILNTSDIGSVVSSGSVSWTEIVELETKVSENNADIGSLGYLCHPSTKAALKQVFTNSTYGDTPVWQKGEKGSEGTLNGYPAYSTSQVPTTISSNKTALIFGNFADLIIGVWGPGIELNLDLSTLSLSGGRRLLAFCDVDIAVRHPESFAAIQDITVV
jgi:HK97 family phage major capsid protein